MNSVEVALKQVQETIHVWAQHEIPSWDDTLLEALYLIFPPFIDSMIIIINRTQN